jgi:TPP-dependent 2-oxoacid decarboxylase
MQPIAVIASPEAVETLKGVAEKEGIKVSKPVNVESPADVLDAPMNPDDIKTTLQMITAIFQTSSAVLGFVTAILKLVQERKEKMVLKNPVNGQIVAEVDSTTTEQELMSKLQK